MTSTASAIRDELYWATLKIPSATRETGYFSVWIERKDNGMDIFVQFETDRASPLTLLQAFSVSLEGNLMRCTCIVLLVLPLNVSSAPYIR